ncbi:hypothetical protein V8C34DRAFT_81890 [Trichoderma compactum]
MKRKKKYPSCKSGMSRPRPKQGRNRHFSNNPWDKGLVICSGPFQEHEMKIERAWILPKGAMRRTKSTRIFATLFLRACPAEIATMTGPIGPTLLSRACLPVFFWWFFGLADAFFYLFVSVESFFFLCFFFPTYPFLGAMFFLCFCWIFLGMYLWGSGTNWKRVLARSFGYWRLEY